MPRAKTLEKSEKIAESRAHFVQGFSDDGFVWSCSKKPYVPTHAILLEGFFLRARARENMGHVIKKGTYLEIEV